jgi:hypothetical protein
VIKALVLSAALLATAFSTQARAQAVVEDPGYCAQFYPSANCQNYGPGNPLYRGGVAPVERPKGYAAPAPVSHHHRHNHRHRG